MTLQQLRYFITVVEKGKINEAAKELFVSQPTLTNSIRELEEELGIKLLNRNNRGISITNDGLSFLSYARQVIEQMTILENKFLEKKKEKFTFRISSQHYAFVVNAFVHLIQEFQNDEYDVTLRECRTYEIIDDVKNNRSQLGILYLNDFNENVLNKYLKENHLEFIELFKAKPHVFISTSNPLSKKDLITLDDLVDYPFLSFEQGQFNSFYFSEEIQSTISRKKTIKVSDRATLFNLLIGLNGYTICSGMISEDLNGKDIISRPLLVDDCMHIGMIKRKGEILTFLGERYIELMKKHIVEEYNIQI